MSPSALVRLLRDAQKLEKRGEVAKAKKVYENVLRIYPLNARAKDALKRLSIRKTPAPPASALNRLNSLYHSGSLENLEKELQEQLTIYPKSFVLWNMLGVVYRDRHDLQRASNSFRKVTRLNPNYADGFNNLGVVMRELGQHHDSVDAFKRALELRPEYSDALINLGIAASLESDTKTAISLFNRALQIDPINSKVLSNLGVAYHRLGNLERSIELFKQALSLNPNCLDTLSNYAYLLMSTKKYSEAEGYLRSALMLDSNNPDLQGYWYHLSRRMCQWEQTPEHDVQVKSLGIETPPVSPWMMLAVEDDLDKQRRRSENYAIGNFPSTRPKVQKKQCAENSPIRVGYFSNDFYAHATLLLMNGIFREHNRAKFQLFLFSYSEISDQYQAELKNQDLVFYDISDQSDAEVIRMAHSSELDIAVDLKGYTEGSRSRLFAQGLAPIQISFLGYPGTMGAPWIDYLIADRTLIPKSCRSGYTEKIIYLPDSYQPNDDRRPIPLPQTRREDFNLPSTGFVFACFNSSFKISDQEYEIWMRAMARVSDSVLWLLSAGNIAERNLRKEAELRGIDGSRIIFATPLGNTGHIERQRHADLFLDTFAVNAHTTASDALWAGLPLVTMCGQQFAARVGASLLKAVGLEELITYDVESYEKRILELSTDRSRLAQIRRKLEVSRDQIPLFDTKNYVNYYEQGLEEACNRYRSGQEPADIFSIQST